MTRKRETREERYFPPPFLMRQVTSDVVSLDGQRWQRTIGWFSLSFHLLLTGPVYGRIETKTWAPCETRAHEVDHEGDDRPLT